MMLKSSEYELSETIDFFNEIHFLPLKVFNICNINSFNFLYF